MRRVALTAAQLLALDALVLGVGWLHVARWVAPQRYLGLAGMVLYACWPLLEATAIVQEARRGSADQDGGTYLTYAVARAAAVTVIVALAGGASPPLWLPAAGVLLLAGGVGLRTAAIQTLGTRYSNRVRWGEQSRLVRTGPYRLLRHPAYAGMLLGNLGLATGLASAAGAAAVLLLLLPAIIRRIVREERELASSADWPAFAASRSRLVPWLW